MNIFINKIKPAILKKKIVICDRFIDSTIAYQVYGKKVKKGLVKIHKYIFKNIKPQSYFFIKVNIIKAQSRLNKKKNKNRYDKFSKSFYIESSKCFY